MYSAKGPERLQFRYSAGEQTSQRAGESARQDVAQILPFQSTETGQTAATQSKANQEMIKARGITRCANSIN
jgi:hypothetical protein